MGLDMASIWPVVCFTEEMLSQRMLMLPLPLSRVRGLSSLLTGVQLDSKLASITSLQPSSQGLILPKFKELFVCSPTPLPLLKPGPDLITSLTSCMPREPLYTGMLERAWRRESSPRPGRTWLLLRKTTRKLEWIVVMLRMLMMNTNIVKLFFKMPYILCSNNLY